MHRADTAFTDAVPAWYGSVCGELRRLAEPVLVQHHGRGLFSVTMEIPLEPLWLSQSSSRPSIFWSRPSEDHRLIGLGQVALKCRDGVERFPRLANDYQALLDDWTHIRQGQADILARAFMGYGFDPEEEPGGLWEGFPNSLIYIPALLVEWKDGHCSISFTCSREERPDPGRVIADWLNLLQSLIREGSGRGTAPGNRLEQMTAEPGAREWLQRVGLAKSHIQKGMLDKVVLGRRVRFCGEHPFDKQRLFNELTERYPGCTLVAITLGQRTLVAATPERLVAQHGRCVLSDAMAGTVRQGEKLGDAAMQKLEHAPVVQAIHRALAPYCESMEIPDSPRRLSLRSLDHLWTPLRGRLKAGVQIFDLIKRLHPTPAVGGVPWRKASSWLAQHDYGNRGWYTGGMGWLSHANEGEFVVLLRCALLKDNEADLFAGAGITACSDPVQELRETELKLAAMRDALSVC